MRPRKKELSGIRLIAKELGVSTATISRALNPETCHKVKESRRRQILELADQMHYRPNPGARILQRGHQNSIAVLVPSEEDLFFSEFYGRFLADSSALLIKPAGDCKSTPSTPVRITTWMNCAIWGWAPPDSFIYPAP
jgi:hypothetical protein